MPHYITLEFWEFQSRQGTLVMLRRESRRTIKELLIAAVLVAPAIYSAQTAWKNGEKIDDLEKGVRGVKESMIALLLEEEPNKSEMVTKLLSKNSPLIDGLGEFADKNYISAFSVWSDAAMKGDTYSAFAIHAAKVSLVKKIESLPEGREREELEFVIKSAPEVEEENDTFQVKFEY